MPVELMHPLQHTCAARLVLLSEPPVTSGRGCPGWLPLQSIWCRELRCRKGGTGGVGGVRVQIPGDGYHLADDDAVREVPNAPEELGQTAC